MRRKNGFIDSPNAHTDMILSYCPDELIPPATAANHVKGQYGRGIKPSHWSR